MAPSVSRDLLDQSIIPLANRVLGIDPMSLEALGRTVERLRTLEVLLFVTYRRCGERPAV